MSTVAYKDGVIACDSAIWSNGIILAGATSKVMRYEGYLLGAVGNLSDMTMFFQYQRVWIINKHLRDKAKHPDISEDFSGIMIDKDGIIYLYDKALVPSKIDLTFHALGSGSQVAIGAMAAGSSATQAVEIAALYDSGSRGPIHHSSLKTGGCGRFIRPEEMGVPSLADETSGNLPD